MRHLGRASLIGAIAIACSSLAQAGDFYVGAGAGHIDASDSIVGPGPTRDSPNGTAWSAFAGYRFNPYAALEAGYTGLGDVHNPGITGCQYAFDTRSRQTSLSAIRRWPIHERFALTGRTGIARTNHSIDDVRPSTNAVPGLFCIQIVRDPPTPADETNAVWGAGVEWNVVSRASLRLTWTRHDNDVRARDVTMLSATWAF